MYPKLMAKQSDNKVVYECDKNPRTTSTNELVFFECALYTVHEYETRMTHFWDFGQLKQQITHFNALNYIMQLWIT